MHYFQYGGADQYPLYFKIAPNCYSPQLKEFLAQSEIHELSADKIENLKKSAVNNARIIEVKLLDQAQWHLLGKSELEVGGEGSADLVLPANFKGSESIYPKENYHIYRFKGEALLVYSYRERVWRLGLSQMFGQIKRHSRVHRYVLNRTLAIGLLPFGVLGVWGLLSQNSNPVILLLKQHQAQGEALFIDFRNKKIINKKIEWSGRPEVHRLDGSVKTGKKALGSLSDKMGAIFAAQLNFDYGQSQEKIQGLVMDLARGCNMFSSSLEALEVSPDWKSALVSLPTPLNPPRIGA